MLCRLLGNIIPITYRIEKKGLRTQVGGQGIDQQVVQTGARFCSY